MSNIKINSFPTRKQYTYAGGAKVFVLDFPFFEDADIFVYVSDPASDLSQEDPDNLLTYSTEYTLTGAGLASGGTVTIDNSVTLDVGFTVTVVGRMVIDRMSILNTNAAITREQYNEDMNRLTMMIQNLNTIVEQTMPKYDRSEDINYDDRSNVDFSMVNLPALGAGEIWYGIETLGVNGLSKVAIGDFDALGLLNAEYILGTANPLLPNAQPLGGLGTGFLYNTDNGTTGVLSIEDPGDLGTEVITVTQASHGFTVKQWLYRDSGSYALAQADTQATSEAIGVVKEVIDSNTFKLQQSGNIASGLSGIADSTIYYLSPTVAGAMTSTPPTGAGEFSKPVFVGTGTSSGWVLSHRTLSTSSSSSSAVTMNVNQTSHGFTVGKILRRDGGSNLYVTAQSDSAANAESLGMVVDVIDVDNFTLQEIGYVTGLSGLTDGTVYFLSPTSAGDMTATEPTTTGQVSKPQFVADSTTSGWLLHYRGMVVGGGGGGTSGGGDWELVETKDLTGVSEVIFTDLESDVCKYKFRICKGVASGGGISYRMLFSTDNGSTFETSSRYSAAISTNFTWIALGTNAILLLSDGVASTHTSTAALPDYGEVILYSPNDASAKTMTTAEFQIPVRGVGASGLSVESHSLYTVAEAHNAVKILTDTNSFASGCIEMYKATCTP